MQRNTPQQVNDLLNTAVAQESILLTPNSKFPVQFPIGTNLATVHNKRELI